MRRRTSPAMPTLSRLKRGSTTGKSAVCSAPRRHKLHSVSCCTPTITPFANAEYSIHVPLSGSGCGALTFRLSYVIQSLMRAKCCNSCGQRLSHCDKFCSQCGEKVSLFSPDFSYVLPALRSDLSFSHFPNKDPRCSRCGGSGKVQRDVFDYPFFCLPFVLSKSSRSWKECPSCYGTGVEGADDPTCPKCNGSGKISHYNAGRALGLALPTLGLSLITEGSQEDCPTCRGTGRI